MVRSYRFLLSWSFRSKRSPSSLSGHLKRSNAKHVGPQIRCQTLNDRQNRSVVVGGGSCGAVIPTDQVQLFDPAGPVDAAQGRPRLGQRADLHDDLIRCISHSESLLPRTRVRLPGILDSTDHDSGSGASPRPQKRISREQHSIDLTRFDENLSDPQRISEWV